MTAAVGWGVLAASSLVIGALLGELRAWPPRLIGLVLAFGAGALISAVSFDLAQEGAQVGDPDVAAAGLAVGAVTYFLLNRLVGRRARGRSGETDDAGTALALGAFLDGVPEQAVLGIGIASGEGVSVGLLVAIFVSNLPEAIGSSTEMRAAGTPPGRSVVCGSSSRSSARRRPSSATPSRTMSRATSTLRSTGSRPERSS